MFYWKDSSESVGQMSKCDILRGIVTEKLSTALQEILAVLQRTVSGYEEEASGLRREISQQNIQLELLKPRINLQRRALVPGAEDQVVVSSEEDRVVVSSEEDQVVVSSEEEQPAEQETGSLGMLWYDDDDEEEEQPKADPKDPDFQITPRPPPPRASDRPQREVTLRVCILEDARTLVLSNTVFKKYPVKEVCFPPGLSEEDFLLLLRSSFPRLTDSSRLEFLRTDRSRRLQRIQLETLTPEDILRTRSSGGEKALLYLRLRKGAGDEEEEDEEEEEEERHLSNDVVMKPDETELSSR
ncbi:hypothetical protein CesoFtcFv8_026511 [Champsocephalus esox]|uniref:Uncharacterized protein n=1 Tax=Champsocephalus esox TaxID=159716 RepID=A0AAN8G5L9_9TELE|nr:hypothetical protein CesoFtcFv8_026511 [Champsocephalus esox]